MGKDEKDQAGKLSDKETVKLGEAENKTQKTTSQGEYSEAKKASMKAMHSYYGKDEDINDKNYTSKMETMIHKDYGPAKDMNAEYGSANKRVLAMMDSEPELSGVLSDMGKGAGFLEVLPDRKSVV